MRTKQEIAASESKCTGGPAFRCHVATYRTNKGGIATKVEMTPIKRLSCHCEKCCYLWNELDENEPDVFTLPEDPVDKGVYRLEVDYNDYIDDGCDIERLEFVKEG